MSMCVCVYMYIWTAQVPGSQALGLRQFHAKFSHGRVLVGSCGIFLAEVCVDPGPEDLVEVHARSLLGGPCVRSLQMPCLRGACVTALVEGFWEVIV
jgi:hypothetical protein